MHPTPFHRLLGGLHQHSYFPIFSLFFCLAACAEHLSRKIPLGDAKRTKSPGATQQLYPSCLPFLLQEKGRNLSHHSLQSTSIVARSVPRVETVAISDAVAVSVSGLSRRAQTLLDPF